jgi:glycosyltransferase involved in cell wall biosynthesis
MQSEKDYEIIIVESGSVDGTYETCRQYAERYSFISLLRTEIKGVSNARNIGLDCAKGKYVYFLDADDVITDRDAFKTLLMLSCSCHAEIVAANCNFYYVDTESVSKNDVSNLSRIINIPIGSDILSELVIGRNGIFNVVWNKLFLRKWLDENNIRFPTDSNISEDMVFMTKTFLVCKTMYFTDKVLYAYTRSTENYLWRRLSSGVARQWVLSCNYMLNSAKIDGNISDDCRKIFKINLLVNIITHASYQFNTMNYEIFRSEILLEKLDLSRPYIFWGASGNALKYLNVDNLYENMIFVDSDPGKTGESLFGYKIISPSDISSYYTPGTKFIVTSMYLMEIYFKLKGMGYVNDLSDLSWDDGESKWMREEIKAMELLLDAITGDEEYNNMFSKMFKRK